MASKPKIDYTLYLVTGRELLPPERDYYEHLEESLKGGVTLVQIREKTADTGEFLEVAQKTKELCDKYGVPVFINDRVDIALAINAVGLHIGQTDMPIDVVRKLLPSTTVIGMSVSSVEEAEKANKAGVDYVGIGALFHTTSKQLKKDVLGVRGVGAILGALNPDIQAVAIGGIKQDNLIRTLHGSVSPSGKALDGVAIISEIVASDDPLAVSRRLARTVRSFIERPHPNLIFEPWSIKDTQNAASGIVERAGGLIPHVRNATPLVHQITNNVAITQSANVTLALGGSPIMATSPKEMDDLSKVIGALLVNFGTIGDLEGMRLAGKAANRNGKPIVFDPVAVGATSHRRTTANELLNFWQATVIKGNPAEISALAGLTEVQSRGVDSVGAGFADPASVVKQLALRERAVVVMTGPVDWISDGNSVFKLSNGHPLLAAITASGCIVGTAVATFCGTANILARTQSTLPPVDEGNGRLVQGDMLLGSIAGVLAITIAGELAGERADVKGPGTFLPALIDELASLTPDVIISRARVEQVV